MCRGRAAESDKFPLANHGKPVSPPVETGFFCDFCRGVTLEEGGMSQNRRGNPSCDGDQGIAGSPVKQSEAT